MKPFPYYALLALMLATLACSISPAATLEPAAELVIPSDTPKPTDTPAPTETSTPLPTATPDSTATAVFRATQSAADTMDEIESLLGSTDVSYKEGHLAWQQPDPLQIKLKGPSDDFLPVGEGLTASNFIFKADVKWEATGILMCGVVFRSEPNIEKGKQYQFIFLRFSGLPAWAIEVYEFGGFKNSPTDVKTSNAVDLANGATNRIVLVVQDDNFTVYINDVRQGRYYDYSKQRMQGAVGLMGTQDSGDGVCEFENSWVWSLD